MRASICNVCLTTRQSGGEEGTDMMYCPSCGRDTLHTTTVQDDIQRQQGNPYFSNHPEGCDRPSRS